MEAHSVEGNGIWRHASILLFIPFFSVWHLRNVLGVRQTDRVQSVIFPPAPRVSKLGNDLAPQGAVWRKGEASSGANVPWCYFAISETTCATNQEIPSLKSVARCSDAIIRAHASCCLCTSRIHFASLTYLATYSW